MKYKLEKTYSVTQSEFIWEYDVETECVTVLKHRRTEKCCLLRWNCEVDWSLVTVWNCQWSVWPSEWAESQWQCLPRCSQWENCVWLCSVMSAPANVTCSANMWGDVVSAALAVLFATVRTVRLEWIATETAVGLCRHCSMRTLSFPSDSRQLVERDHPFSVNKCDSHYLIFCSIDVSGHPANYHKFTLNWLLNCALLMRSIFGEVWVVKPSSVWQVAAMFSSCFFN